MGEETDHLEARPQAILKQRAIDSSEFGEKLYGWIKKGARHAREQLKADGIVLGGGWESQLSQFKRWWRMYRLHSRCQRTADDYTEIFQKHFPESSPEKLAAVNQHIFTMEAADDGDSKEYREMEYLRLAKEKGEREKAKLQLDRQKLELVFYQAIEKAVRDPKTREIVESNVSNAEKIAQLRQIYFADVDALEKSGSVQIPRA